MKERKKFRHHQLPGPDPAYIKVLKECNGDLSCPLTSLFSIYVISGCVPRNGK